VHEAARAVLIAASGLGLLGVVARAWRYSAWRALSGPSRRHGRGCSYPIRAGGAARAMEDTQRERRTQPERQRPQNPLAVKTASPDPHSTSRTRARATPWRVRTSVNRTRAPGVTKRAAVTAAPGSMASRRAVSGSPGDYPTARTSGGIQDPSMIDGALSLGQYKHHPIRMNGIPYRFAGKPVACPPAAPGA
jgi:hypothetical protein